MKIVINKCYGGFGLSCEAQVEYLKLLGKKAYFYKQTKFSYQGHGNEHRRVDNPKMDESMFLSCLTVDLGEKVKELKYKKGEYFYGGDLERTDANLIKVVEKLGAKANGRCAELKIIEIPDGVKWEIDEYDGLEHIAEMHNTWG